MRRMRFTCWMTKALSLSLSLSLSQHLIHNCFWTATMAMRMRLNLAFIHTHLAALYNRDAMFTARYELDHLKHGIQTKFRGSDTWISLCVSLASCVPVYLQTFSYKFRSDAMFAILKTHKTVPRSVIFSERLQQKVAEIPPLSFDMRVSLCICM